MGGFLPILAENEFVFQFPLCLMFLLSMFLSALWPQRIQTLFAGTIRSYSGES